MAKPGCELQVRQQDGAVGQVGQTCRLVNDAGGGDLENVRAAGDQRDIPGGIHGAVRFLLQLAGASSRNAIARGSDGKVSSRVPA